MQSHRVTFLYRSFFTGVGFFFFFEWTFVLCSAHGVCLIWSCIPQPLVYSHAVFAFCFLHRTANARLVLMTQGQK